MAHSKHHCQSTTVPEAVERQSNRLAIDLNRPPQDDQDPNSPASDSKVAVSAGQSGTSPVLFIGEGLSELNEGDEVYRRIKKTLISSLAEHGGQVTSVAIHRNCYSSVSAKGRAKAFQVFLKQLQTKGGDNTANVKYAWYATSKEELSKILSYGFGYSGKPENDGLYGCGAYFSPYEHPLESAISASMDADGLKHILLCRVILGKSKLVDLGSEQSQPSSEQYDSGVDNLSSPRKYIVWSTHMNTHVLPEYIVSFKVTCCEKECFTTPERSLRLISPWLSFPTMISELVRILPPAHVSLMSKYREEFKEGKITRNELILKIRLIAGDNLLSTIFDNHRTKQTGESSN